MLRVRIGYTLGKRQTCERSTPVDVSLNVSHSPYAPTVVGRCAEVQESTVASGWCVGVTDAAAKLRVVLPPYGPPGTGF